jgi:hypothetical protein
MRPEEKLYAALTAGSPTPAVSVAVENRIYPGKAPFAGSDLPCIVYRKDGSLPDRTIQSQVPVWSQVTFTVLCLDVDYKSAEELADLVEVLQASVDGFRVVDRSADVGELEDSANAAVLTIEVDVQP